MTLCPSTSRSPRIAGTALSHVTVTTLLDRMSPTVRSRNNRPRTTSIVSIHMFALAAFLLLLLATHDSFSQETSSTWIYEECDSFPETRLRDQLNSITQSVLEDERGQMNLARIVERAWLRTNVDEALDIEIDRAVESVSEDESLLRTIESGWSAETAQYMAEKVLSYLSRSPYLQRVMDQFMAEATDAIDKEIEHVIIKSGSSALLCVQTYINANISESMVATFQDHLIQITPDLSSDEISIETGLDPKTFSTSIAAFLLGNITKIVARRIGTGVLSRVLGVAGGALPIVGWALALATVADIIASVRGAFPKIRKELKTPATRAMIREQIEAAVKEELRTSLPEAGRAVSNHIISEWRAFRKKYARVIRLSEENARFATILNHTNKEELQKLSNLLAMLDEFQSSEEIYYLIETGDFERIFALPEKSFAILRTTRDARQIIMWADLTGDRLSSVIDTEMFRSTSPDQFSDRNELDMVLSLKNLSAIRKATSLDRRERNILFGLPTEIVRYIIDELSQEELSWLISSIAEMPVREAYRLADCVLQHPELRTELKPIENLFDRIRYALGPKKLEKCVS